MHFDIHNWSGNGPSVITQTMKKFCGLQSTTFNNVTPEQCHGFKILPVDKCLSITYHEFRKFYDKNDLEEVMQRLEPTHFVHFWNKMGNNKQSIQSKVAYIELAKEYCPIVIENCNGYI